MNLPSTCNRMECVPFGRAKVRFTNDHPPRRINVGSLFATYAAGILSSTAKYFATAPTISPCFIHYCHNTISNVHIQTYICYSIFCRTPSFPVLFEVGGSTPSYTKVVRFSYHQVIIAHCYITADLLILKYINMTAIPDTIAAIGTAPGEGGIAIIRVSGPESLSIADKIFKCSPPLPSERPSPSVVYGHIISEGTMLDESLLLIMRAPRSYTREDVVEFHCHGGTISAKRILRAVLKEKIRLAEPGEFTKRAFLNGRIDLLQAEAVLDIIKARTDRSATAAIEQLEGSLSASFKDIYSIILGSCADLEATLDFIEEELPGSFMLDVVQRLKNALQKINSVLSTWDEGHILREGAIVVISGKPNAGKSTLLNALLGKDRVIVSPIPGTTRDVIEEQIVIDGIPIRLVDTAGLRSSGCSLEQEGVRRAKNQIERADVNLHVIDASRIMEAEDYKNIGSLDQKKTIIVLNKIDLGFVINPTTFSDYASIKTQASANKGISEIKTEIIKKLGVSKYYVHQFVISERHRNILIASRADLVEAIDMLCSHDESYIVLAASKVRSALDRIAQATGKKYHQELLDSIFNRFCIGK